MEQVDMFADEIKVSRIKKVLGSLKFWGNKTKETVVEVVNSEEAREIGTAMKESTIEAIKTPLMRHVLGGGIAGAMIGTLIPIPFVGTAVGASIGATLGFYHGITK